jgi:invasion protein IalB
MACRLRNVFEKIQGPGGRLAPGALLLATLLLASTVAGAAFVTYLRSYGDWSVSCALDEPTGYRWCTLQAPPPELYDQRSEIAVSEQRDGAFLVTVRVRGAVRAGAPVYLRIDDNPPYRAEPSRVGEATWRGDEAAALAEELQSGLNMVLRWFPASGAPPRDEQFSLDGFGNALADYRARLR